MIKPFRALYQRILAESEEETEDDGYISWQGEWHSALWGLSVGILYAITGEMAILTVGVGWLFTRGADNKVPEVIPYPQQFIKESGYLIGHTVAGIVIVYILKYGISLL